MRESGILLPISSLPSGYGIGCFSKEAYTFADQLASAGQKYWQILPLGPTSYEGEPNYKDYTSLKETSYGADGLRAVLLQKNAVAVNKVRELKQQKLDLKITDDEFKKQVSEIKSGKDTPTVIIKATDDASYMNLIDALDEMQICNIGKYVITDIAEADEFLMKNYDAKGELSQNLADN